MTNLATSTTLSSNGTFLTNTEDTFYGENTLTTYLRYTVKYNYVL